MTTNETPIHPCNLRTTTLDQRRAVEETEKAFEQNPEVTLLSAHAGWGGYDGPGLAVRFIYRYNDDHGEGLEVTIFAEDGTVLDSQDFG